MRARWRCAVLAAAAVPVALVSCARPPDPWDRTLPVLDAPPLIRVALARKVPSVSVSCEGDYLLRALPGGELLDSGRSLAPTAVGARAGSLVWGDRLLPAGRVVLEPAEPWAGLGVAAGVPCRGRLILACEEAERVTAVNELGLEEYLEGVLPAEAPMDWPAEALAAQAIASRTYALSRLRRRPPGGLFDVTAGTDSQVYAGVKRDLSPVHRAKLREALAVTRGVVLVFGDTVFQANFHAVCGGHTDPAWLLVGGEAVTPLRGVPCEFCREAARLPSVAARYRWRFEISERELREAVREAAEVSRRFSGAIRSVRTVAVGPGGHGARIAVETDRGEAFEVEANRLRAAFGWERLLSPAFTATRLSADRHGAGDRFVFEGRGWGHGGGMCQWGAWAMAQRNFTAADILLYYYPGSGTRRVY